MTFDGLSPRHRQVVLLLWSGQRQKEVAFTLQVSRATVREHVHAIAKLLPGPGSAMQKILLWRAECILRRLPDPTIVGLPACLITPNLARTPTHADKHMDLAALRCGNQVDRR